MEREPKRHSLKKDIKKVRRSMTKYSSSLIIREDKNPIDNEMSPHTTDNGQYQKLGTNSVCGNVVKGEPSFITGGAVFWLSLYRKQSGEF